MIDIDLAHLYTSLVSRNTIKDRFDQGGTADLKLHSSRFVVKTDKLGFQFVEREFKFMTQLWQAGFRAMPKPEINRGLFFIPSATFIMEEVGYGLTLEEILEAWEEKQVSDTMLDEILKVHVQTYRQFWALGGVHADPHLKNFVVGMDQQQNWRTWIIDFGMSLWEGNDDRAMPTTVSTIAQDQAKHLNYLAEWGLDTWVEADLLG